MVTNPQGNEQIEMWHWSTASPSGVPVFRGDAHRDGIPHEGVHLWIIRRRGETCDLLFQERSPRKEHYPGTLDITVGGHVPFGLGDNKIQKESMEEIGIAPDDNDLFDLGYYRYEEKNDILFHREFQRVYLYPCVMELSAYRFIDGEVTGIYAVPYEKIILLMKQDCSFRIEGFDGKEKVVKIVDRSDFHPLFFEKTMEEYMRVLLTSVGEYCMTNNVTAHMPSPV